MEIKLTDSERLILANQYEILGHLQDRKDHKLIAQQLRNGHEYLYRDALQVMSPAMTSGETDFVIDAISMYQALKKCYIKLGSPGDIDASKVEWPGFDGNNDAPFYQFTCALAEDGQFVQELGERGVNSHSPKVASYISMLRKWNDLGRPQTSMSSEQIKNLLQPTPKFMLGIFQYQRPPVSK